MTDIEQNRGCVEQKANLSALAAAIQGAWGDVQLLDHIYLPLLKPVI